MIFEESAGKEGDKGGGAIEGCERESERENEERPSKNEEGPSKKDASSNKERPHEHSRSRGNGHHRWQPRKPHFRDGREGAESSGGSGGSGGSGHQAIRIDVDILERIRREAKYKRMRVDDLLNKILRDALFRTGSGAMAGGAVTGGAMTGGTKNTLKLSTNKATLDEARESKEAKEGEEVKEGKEGKGKFKKIYESLKSMKLRTLKLKTWTRRHP
ncbi:MAG: hypothetical protein HQK53_07555 [Oligoflexia bacterium]|nr:hypothetical protein [Oligoflexia bacterium]